MREENEKREKDSLPKLSGAFSLGFLVGATTILIVTLLFNSRIEWQVSLQHSNFAVPAAQQTHKVVEQSPIENTLLPPMNQYEMQQ